MLELCSINYLMNQKKIKKMKNRIGLDKKGASTLAEKLNDLLANYQVFYMNTRGFHWNIQGKEFFELHVKFEELYDDLVIKVDEIAERILTLEGKPLHTFSEYLKISYIKELENVTNGPIAVQHLLDTFKIIIVKQREILAFAGEVEDEGTGALMSDYIREQEKLVWMYSSFMK